MIMIVRTGTNFKGLKLYVFEKPIADDEYHYNDLLKAVIIKMANI